jgi:HEAT repeat protein
MVLAFVVVLLGGPQVESTAAAEAPPPVIAARGTILGDDKIAATSALEKLSLEGGAGSVELVADFIERWKGDAEMQRRGHSALRRLPVDAAALAQVIAKDESPARRAWAAWTAGEHRASAAAEALLGALKDSDAQVRLRAVAALGVIGDPRAVEPIQRMLVHERDPATRERAERAFQALSAPRVDPEPVDSLIEKLSSKDVFERLTAATALEKRGDHRAVGPVLRTLEKERDLQVRKLLIGALVTMKDEIAVPDLIRIAKQDTVDVRLHAIGALALLEDSRAIDPLLDMTRSAGSRS